MGTRHAIGYGRHPKEETMKRFTTIDFVTILGIIASLLLVLGIGGCAHSPTPADTVQCCKRLSLQSEQMSTFNRYCKVALFLSRSTNKAVGKMVQKNATAAVKVCKFVFDVDTDDELVAAGDKQEYYRVRSYIIAPEDGFWRQSLPCDPAEAACEEF
jgi:hypothetical protein